MKLNLSIIKLEINFNTDTYLAQTLKDLELDKVLLKEDKVLDRAILNKNKTKNNKCKVMICSKTILGFRKSNKLLMKAKRTFNINSFIIKKVLKKRKTN